MAGPQILEVGANPIIHLGTVAGDLVVSGAPQSQLQMTGGVRQEVTVDADDVDGANVVRLVSDDDCVLRVPYGSTLHVGHVHGDASFQGIGGMVHVAQINGDMSLNQSAGVVIQTVNGDLSVNGVDGDLHIGTVAGDAAVTRIGGDCRVHTVHGDLALSFVRGNIDAAADDDLSLRIALTPGTAVNARAGGDLSCRVPQDVDAVVSLQAGGEIELKRLPVDVEHAPDGAHAMSFTLGGGAATLNLVADGDVELIGVDPQFTGFGADFGQEFAMNAAEFAQQIASQVEAQVQSVTRQLDEKLSQLAADEQLATRIQEKVQSAMRTAELKIAEAMRKADEKARAAERKAAQQSKGRQGGYAWTWQAPSPPPKPAKPEAPTLSDEERMMILRMVEQGKLSVEQAEQLLSALRKR
ncbi:MAG: hypothetical protein H6644_04450 [Caldilineaceae bacterium]|nr:hypothetical protein [Caldilineaceae bacterium]